jgi:4-alpha-glucanotransferase
MPIATAQKPYGSSFARLPDGGLLSGVPNSPLPQLHARGAGVLLHITSLPGPFGSGDLGDSARRFIDFLASAAQSYWQTLPVGPTGYGNSPYSAQSAFAGSPLLISLSQLVARGWLSEEDLATATHSDDARVDFARVQTFRSLCLRRAFELGKDAPELAQFREQEQHWLEDYALFRALKSQHGEVEWTRWDPEFRDRDPQALAQAREVLEQEIAFRCFEQWLFASQWSALRDYAHGRGVALIGDMPIFLAHDSADVWQHRELFQLDAEGAPRAVAGVPPDYFSATGQRWGNPLYDWRKLHAQRFGFWLERMRSELTRFDIVRLDHFIGYERYWEIPGDEPTAVRGRWVQGPSSALFETLQEQFGPLPLIAEDLGATTPEVKELRDRFGLPGIRILQFAFGDDPNAPDFKPHNYPREAVVYTGTHDNDTTVGWFFNQDGGNTRSSEQVELEQRAALDYLGKTDPSQIHWDMIRTCYASVANTVIVPLQDLLGLGSEARMNRPGTHSDNWQWRATSAAFSPALADKLAHLTRLYERQQPRAADVHLQPPHRPVHHTESST